MRRVPGGEGLRTLRDHRLPSWTAAEDLATDGWTCRCARRRQLYAHAVGATLCVAMDDPSNNADWPATGPLVVFGVVGPRFRAGRTSPWSSNRAPDLRIWSGAVGASKVRNVIETAKKERNGKRAETEERPPLGRRRRNGVAPRRQRSRPRGKTLGRSAPMPAAAGSFSSSGATQKF